MNPVSEDLGLWILLTGVITLPSAFGLSGARNPFDASIRLWHVHALWITAVVLHILVGQPFAAVAMLVPVLISVRLVLRSRPVDPWLISVGVAVMTFAIELTGTVSTLANVIELDSRWIRLVMYGLPGIANTLWLRTNRFSR